jgi:hypothetical protein
MRGAVDDRRTLWRILDPGAHDYRWHAAAAAVRHAAKEVL